MMFKGKEVKEITELDCFSLTGIADKQFIGIYEPGENEDKVLLQVVNLECLLEGGGETLFGDIYCIENRLAFVDPDDPHTALMFALFSMKFFLKVCLKSYLLWMVKVMRCWLFALNSLMHLLGKMLPTMLSF